jgi:oleate hydratase
MREKMSMQSKHTQVDAVAYLIGGGIASLAAAAFLIRDGNFKGHNVRILEESPQAFRHYAVDL